MLVDYRKNVIPLWLILFLSHFFYTSISNAASSDSYDDTEPDNNSTISLDVSGDKKSGSDYFISASTLLDDSHDLYFSAGTQNYSADNDTETRLYAVTVEDQTDTLFNSGFGLEWWGKKDVITTRSVIAILRYNRDNFSFSLSPRIQRTFLKTGTIRYNLSSDGWRATFYYFFPRNWYVSLRRNKNNFYNVNISRLRDRYVTNALDRNLDVRLNRNDIQTIFSAPLDLYRNSLTLGTQYGVYDVTIDYSESEYLIVQGISTLISASLSLPLSKTMTVNGQIGESAIKGDDESSLLIFSGGITISF